jgi:predicted N-acyltransferase
MAWDELLGQQANPTPFMRHAYLDALHTSGSADSSTGWMPRFFTLEADGELAAACVVYVKTHSYGEYVFDWAWARAYQDHGLSYYPKAVIAVPFTPVTGSRLLARTPHARLALLERVKQWCQLEGLSSLHLLFADPEDTQASDQVGLMRRTTVQFHWSNTSPPFTDFDAFLVTLSQEKRKKIRQERRKVADAGVRFVSIDGSDITEAHWDFFYRCYERTYLEHGNAPYLSRGFFTRMARAMPENWVLFIAERDQTPIASSLIAVSAYPERPRVAFGRYWGALERVDCLHFEACYYQPLEWCIRHQFDRFEGGAQGEHKMARALLPATTHSSHWLAHSGFADAVQNFLAQEDQHLERYLEDLHSRSPLRNGSHQ